MFSVPAQHQTDPAKAPGQQVNPVTPTPRAVRGSLGEVIDRMQQREAASALFHAAANRLCEAS